jgi:hypothetical protein
VPFNTFSTAFAKVELKPSAIVVVFLVFLGDDHSGSCDLGVHEKRVHAGTPPFPGC